MSKRGRFRFSTLTDSVYIGIVRPLRDSIRAQHVDKDDNVTRWHSRFRCCFWAVCLLGFIAQTAVAADKQVVPLVSPFTGRLLFVDAAADELLDGIGTATTEPPPSLPPPPAASVGKEVQIEGPGALEALESEADDEEDEENKSQHGALVFTYVPGTGDQLGMFGFDFRDVPNPELPTASTLSMNTGWGITWLTGPKSTDLPPQLFHVTIDIGGITKINDEVVMDLAITPAWYTDWVNRRPEAFRLGGRGAWYYRFDESVQLAAGFVYLNRDDIPALPIAGVVLGNNESGRRFELVFPRPKLAWRVAETETADHWFYVNGELGGGSWAIKRTDRTPDVVTYRDYRLMSGFEFRRKKGHRGAIEAGWLFGRAIESRTGRGDYDPQDGFITRIWLDY
jgi:hypothetical protein